MILWLMPSRFSRSRTTEKQDGSRWGIKITAAARTEPPAEEDAARRDTRAGWEDGTVCKIGK